MVLAAVLTVSCLLGVRSRTSEPPRGLFCPPRWTAADDPSATEADEARAALEVDLPPGAEALLPARAVRLAEGCPLELPLHIEEGRCYLYAVQVIARDERPRARLRFPDPESEDPREVLLNHGMAETHGEGADPVCYEDSFDDTVELSVAGTGTLMWVQVYEFTPAAAREWASLRRSRLAAMHAAAAEEAQREVSDCVRREVPDGGAPDGGVPDGGLPDGGMPDGGISAAGAAAEDPCLEPPSSVADGGVPEGGASDSLPDGGASTEGGPLDGDVGCEGDGDMPDGAVCEAGPPPPPEPVEPPPPPVPEGPLAIELEEQCQDGTDNDQDGRPDCADPDCAAVVACRVYRNDRTPWLRTLDLRVGGAFRIGSDSIGPDQSYASEYEQLSMSSGGGGQVAAVWRPSRYLGVGLDLGLSSLNLEAESTGGADWRLMEVSLFTISLGLSVHFSLPIWIMEIGGTVGMGWLHVRTDARWHPLSGDDLEWRDDETNDRSSNHPYGSGWLWVDFWVTDYLSLGIYGGVLASLNEVIGLPANDYHVGLRTTLRLAL